ncbi:MAG TPA: 50S ribosomal protein L29 [Thermoanaerobaculia bacterium]|nr:50S ribosomal protein L29 [Thermoanaerobaculia bacterium]
MKKKDLEQLRGEAPDALKAKEKELRDALWKLRLQKTTGQLENPSRLRTVRRDIARVKTFARANGEKA